MKLLLKLALSIPSGMYGHETLNYTTIVVHMASKVLVMKYLM